MKAVSRSVCAALVSAAVVFALSACGGGSSGSSSPMPQTDSGGSTMSNSASTQQQSQSVMTTAVDTDTSNLSDNDFDSDPSVLKQLDDQLTIGSTVDPFNGDQNPYGLDVAKANNGKIAAGDLVICNFNNNNAGGNIQGQGQTIVALHPHVGSTPTRIAGSEELLGCNALALAPNNTIWAAAFVDNDNPIVSPTGTIISALDGGPWDHPFGEAFSPHAGFNGSVAAFYVTNAGNGSIVRVNIFPNKPFSFDVIATGFPVNHGAPGGILGPSGLQYDALRDRLTVIDGTNNAVYFIRHVSTIPAHGLRVNPGGTTFGGPFFRRGRLVFMGAPLNGPISSAILFDGHIAIGNTLDPNGKNLIVEINPRGQLLFVRNVDTGPAGSIFGMVSTGSSLATERLYYNNDNNNQLRVLKQ
jgi:hypothetical protein